MMVLFIYAICCALSLFLVRLEYHGWWSHYRDCLSFFCVGLPAFTCNGAFLWGKLVVYCLMVTMLSIKADPLYAILSLLIIS